MLQEVVILDESSSAKQGTVRLGSRVSVREDGYPEVESFQIVGPAEADPTVGKISHESPLGQALIGKRLNATVKVKAPGGDTVFKIMRIE